jgi:hypothetical protein
VQMHRRDLERHGHGKPPEIERSFLTFKALDCKGGRVS